MKLIVFLGLVLLVCLNSCTDEPVKPNMEQETPIPEIRMSGHGMVLIGAKDKSTILGSSDLGAATDERPATTASFSYDYWMDTTEITIRTYATIMHGLPSYYGSSVVLDSSVPVCNLTWYDAVLFCNRRSLASGLDTVYVYSAIQKNTSGQVIGLENLSSQLNSLGFRLPTEAEWEFAAKAGVKTDYAWGSTQDPVSADMMAWYNQNSGSQIHSVEKKVSNAYHLYDMLGNALEWTHDIKTTYQGNPVRDFVGSSIPGGTPRSVKGGCYARPLENLRFAKRTDIYDVSASTSAEYVGFRCVVGRIQNPYVSEDYLTGKVTNPIIIKELNLQTQLGHPAKLAFVNVTGVSRTLCVLDATGSYPKLFEYLDRRDCYFPSISPDGNWVAFCTNNFGELSVSHTFIRRLDKTGSGLIPLPDSPAFAPKWWVDPITRDTFIVYGTSGGFNSDPSWKTEQTKRIKFSAGNCIGTPTLIETSGSYYGGLSASGNYLATGYNLLRMKNIKSGISRILFVGPNNGKSASDTSQVCNVSVSPSVINDDRVLHLDFGYGQVSSLVGAAYKSHQIIFMTDFSNQVHHWYRAPENLIWDHPRWSNNTDFAAATTQNNRGDHQSIYCINLKDSLYFKTVAGTDLWHPSLWIDGENAPNSETFSLDSLGQYNDPPGPEEQLHFAYKMHLFWRNASELEIAFLGNSLIYCGVDCSKISHFKSLNMAYTNCGIATETHLVREYLIPNCPKLKMVSVCVPFYFFICPEGDGIPWSTTLATSKGYQYDLHHQFWADINKPTIKSLYESMPMPGNLTCYDSLGMLLGACNGWGGDVPPIDGPIGWTTSHPEFIRNWKLFTALADTLANHKIHFMPIVFPENPAYKNTVAMFRGGPEWATGHAIMDSLRAYESTHPYFHLYDAYQDGNHDYTSDQFLNANHLCVNGAARMAQKIDSIALQILPMSP